jgi:hypothetical protein
MIRAKMKCEDVVQLKDGDGVVSSETTLLSAVINDCPENKDWSKWTPAAHCRIQITNPACFGKFAKGEDYYIDFSPVKA